MSLDGCRSGARLDSFFPAQSHRTSPVSSPLLRVFGASSAAPFTTVGMYSLLISGLRVKLHRSFMLVFIYLFIIFTILLWKCSCLMIAPAVEDCDIWFTSLRLETNVF